MSSSFEKSIKGATKLKLAPPKAKYIEHILSGTRAGEGSVEEIFRTLALRIRDSTWTISFKGLIVVHIMIREGQPNAALAYLAVAGKRAIAAQAYTEVQTQGQNILNYSNYILERARSFSRTKVDYVGRGNGRMKTLGVEKGLLMETEAVQRQIQALLKCEFFAEEPENEISLCAFRLLVMDLLVLFQVENEGTMSVLEKYFELSKPDAERALQIYKTFTKQTNEVVKFLQMARQYEYATRLEIPKIKHAPISLAASLEEYLHDKDFEINRRQYLAQQEAKRTGKPVPKVTEKSSSTLPTGGQRPAFPSPTGDKFNTTQATKGPAPDLIDFFESIEQNQQTLGQPSTNPFQQPQYTNQTTQYAQYPQPTGFVAQQNGFPINDQFSSPQQSTNPFAQFQQPQQTQAQPQPPPQPQQIQPQYTGAGFGGYTPQPQQPQPTGQQWAASPSTNPFNSMNGNNSPFGPQQQQQATGFQPQQTGFGQQQQQQQQQQPMHQQTMPPQPTGFGQQQASNPFRQNSLPTVMEQQPAPTGNPFTQHQNQSQPSFVQSPPPFVQSPPPFSPQGSSPFGQQHQQPQQMMPQRTGTNPFAKQPAQAQPLTGAPTGSLLSNATGSMNPFRQSAFVNQQTGQGWQAGPQATMGGLENLQTNSVFPRPGQPQQAQQQQQPQQTGQWPY